MTALTFEQWLNPSQKATDVATKYHDWQGQRDAALASWAEIEAFIYATDTNSLPNAASAFDHTTHIPITAEIRDDLVAIMYSTILPHNDWLGWKAYGRDAMDAAKQAKATAYIENRHTLNGFRPVARQLIEDYITYGNCISQTISVDERPVIDEDGTLGVGYVGPKVRRISPYDFVMNPAAPSFKESPKIVSQLVDLAWLVKNGDKLGFNKEVVQEILDSRGGFHNVTQATQYKNQQYIPAGFNSWEAYVESGMVELLWFYGDAFVYETGELEEDRLLVVADRGRLLLDKSEPNPRIHHVGWMVKPDNLWGQSPLSQIIGMNYQINHRENAKSDAIDKFIYPDRVLLGDIDQIYDDETGETTWVGDANANVNYIQPEASVLSFDNEVDRLLNHARNAARLPPQLAGFRTPGEKTLGEVQSLNDGAFRGFIHKAEHFELNLLEPVISDELELGAESLQLQLQVPSTTDAALPSTLNITQDDLRSNGKLVPYGARRFARDLQQMNMLMTIANSNLAGLVGQHTITWKLAQAVERLGGFEKYELFTKFGAIDEQTEAQMHQAAAEQNLQQSLSQPSLQEDAITAQLGGFSEGDDSGIS